MTRSDWNAGRNTRSTMWAAGIAKPYAYRRPVAESVRRVKKTN